jgi:hypothetical protein
MMSIGCDASNKAWIIRGHKSLRYHLSRFSYCWWRYLLLKPRYQSAKSVRYTNYICYKSIKSDSWESGKISPDISCPLNRVITSTYLWFDIAYKLNLHSTSHWCNNNLYVPSSDQLAWIFLTLNGAHNIWILPLCSSETQSQTHCWLPICYQYLSLEGISTFKFSCCLKRYRYPMNLTNQFMGN